ncbi:MAG: hypothetical protein IPF82_16430 [Blastocatellia bacterium]|nr:hypothetical protein [Blastocatellia bacterium]
MAMSQMYEQSVPSASAHPTPRTKQRNMLFENATFNFSGGFSGRPVQDVRPSPVKRLFAAANSRRLDVTCSALYIV